MSRASFLVAAAFGLAALASRGHAARADASPVVAKVGARVITAAELEQRLGAVPPFQLRTFGSTPDEIKRNFLSRVLVQQALLAQGAEDRGLGTREDVRERARTVLRNAMLAKLRADVHANAKPTDAEVRAYYEKNAPRYHTPARLNLWQILVDKREEAVAAIAELKKDPTTKHWNEVCRERSVDKVTNMKGGNLGFVLPDGTTGEPAVKAEAEVIRAASAAKDGELIEEPVKAGERWAVVWRKTAAPAVDRTLEMETPSIRQILIRERTDSKIKESLVTLRKQQLTEHSPELLELFDVTSGGELSPVRRPGTLPPPRKIVANPVPAPGGLR